MAAGYDVGCASDVAGHIGDRAVQQIPIVGALTDSGLPDCYFFVFT